MNGCPIIDSQCTLKEVTLNPEILFTTVPYFIDLSGYTMATNRSTLRRRVLATVAMVKKLERRQVQWSMKAFMYPWWISQERYVMIGAHTTPTQRSTK